MAEPKTQPNDLSVEAVIAGMADPTRRQDCRALVEMMRRITGSEPRMWGSSIVGFGSYHYRYASGHEGDACLTGFAARGNALTLYIMAGLAQYSALLARLGPHRLGKSCLYLKRLSDIDPVVLTELLSVSAQHIRQKYAVPTSGSS